MSSKKSWLIGADPHCDLVVDAPGVSGRHCRLTLSDAGYLLEDLGSTNGTYVNGVRIEAKVKVHSRDVVLLGRDDPMPWPAEVSPSETPVAGGLDSRQRTTVFGRDADCDVALSFADVSKKHARLTVAGNRAKIVDLESANGTFVNQRRIDSPCEVFAGDVVSLGRRQLLIQPDLSARRINDEAIVVQARGVGVDAGGKKLLQNVSLTLLPTEFVGLMGPSGAGKSTLMNALNGYCPPSSGQVLFGGRDVYEHYDLFRNRIGYVPQDDIIHRDLTVAEALEYTARLRLPKASAAEIRDRIRSVVGRLGLAGIEGVLIGSPEKKGISGGQRKRVNLAMELLTDPAVLFLDEPTSGLSSEDALTVMRLLRQLADDGKVILLTIHQPSLEAFRLMDRLALISRDTEGSDPGELAYFGPAYPEAVSFFNPELGDPATWQSEPQPGEILSALKPRDTRKWVATYSRSPHYERFVRRRAVRHPALEPGEEAAPAPPSPASDSAKQWLTLTARNFRIKVRDAANSAVLLAQAPVVATLIVLIFGADVRQRATEENWATVTGATAMAVFMMVLSALWFGCSNAAREIVGEWSIYHRERMVNLNLASYIASKFSAMGALCLLQCGILLGIAHWGCGLRSSLPGFYFVLLLLSLTGVGIGLLVSACARTSEVAIAMLPIILIPMIVLGGVMQPTHKMHPLVRQLATLAPSRWGFEAAILMEAKSRELGPSVFAGLPGAGSENDESRPDFASHYFPKGRRTGTVACCLALLMMSGGATACVLLALRQRDVH